MKFAFAAATLAVCAAFSVSAQAFDGYRLESATTLKNKGGGWDGVSLDQERGKLYIGLRKEGLQVFDLKTKKVVRTIAGTEGSSGGTLIPDFDLGISNNAAGSITPFKLSTGKAAAPIAMGGELEDSVYDPATKRLVVKLGAKGDATEFVVLEVPSLRKIGTIALPSKRLDGSAVDGKGQLFVDARDKNVVFRVDMKSLQVNAEWKIDHCEVPSGMDIDPDNQRLFVGCRGKGDVKPVLAVLDTRSGKTVYTHEIGRQNGGVIYDAGSKRIFTANGYDAFLVVFQQYGPDTYKPVEALGTRPGARTIAFDEKTRKLYTVAAEGSADFEKKINTGVGPFYPNTYFPDTLQVLTYGRK